MNLEAKSLHSWKTSRHCIVTRYVPHPLSSPVTTDPSTIFRNSFQDLTIEQFREIRSKAGGLIVLLPRDLAALSAEEQQHLYALEQAMLAQDISIPVYFSPYSDKFNAIIEDISTNRDAGQQQTTDQQRDSALSEIIHSVSANGYQITVTGAVHTANKQSRIPIIQGELAPLKLSNANGKAGEAGGVELNSKLPLIIVTAHLDTFGLTSVSSVWGG